MIAEVRDSVSGATFDPGVLWQRHFREDSPFLVRDALGKALLSLLAQK
jgi:hypothetical protein